MIIEEKRGADAEIAAIMVEMWGSTDMALDGKLYDLTARDCLVCREGETLLGFLHYVVRDRECEILSLDCPVPRRGAGTALIVRVREIARERGAKRLIVVTTNDNTTALRFYQKRGFDISGMRFDAVTRCRDIKPEIPELGDDGIPIRHEIVLQMEV